MGKRDGNNNGIRNLLIALIIIFIVATGIIIKLCLDLTSEPIQQVTDKIPVSLPIADREAVPTEPTVETTIPEPEHVVSTASIGAMGDLLMHMPIFDDHTKYNAAVQQKDGSYDFSTVFQYLSEYTSALDFTVANLETTLAAEDNGYSYSGYPLFNCPDEVVDGVKNAGFDMLLTANNHSYDTRLVGFKRTLEVIRGKGIKTLGTYLSADETKWTVEEINGIKIGMVSYTYATGETEPGRPSLNNNQAISESGLCNYFNTNNLEAFYTQLEGYLEEMKEAGADATILFIHWGVEYMLEENQTQNDMAQALCDLGIDVIIGGHPHVVQPVELLTSTVDPEHRTVCLYSMGNAVSNQRLGFSQAISTAHTEDGILFTVTFEKYSDGTVYLAQVNGLPTWVNKHRNDEGKDEYNILPLDDTSRDAWDEKYGLNDKTIKACADSFDRTIAIVGEGIEQANDYLNQEKVDREAYYLSLLS